MLRAGRVGPRSAADLPQPPASTVAGFFNYLAAKRLEGNGNHGGRGMTIRGFVEVGAHRRLLQAVSRRTLPRPHAKMAVTLCPDLVTAYFAFGRMRAQALSTR